MSVQMSFVEQCYSIVSICECQESLWECKNCRYAMNYSIDINGRDTLSTRCPATVARNVIASNRRRI